jgi:hypothetical protein
VTTCIIKTDSKVVVG